MPVDDSLDEAVFIGLGSNLADPAAQIYQAFDHLQNVRGTTCLRRSSLYQSRPLGRKSQPDYINAAAMLKTRLDPLQMLQELKRIERIQGRIPTAERWASRILDLDILLYGQRTINEPALHVPHPGMRERAFVLIPLLEIDPALRFPDGTLVRLAVKDSMWREVTLLT